MPIAFISYSWSSQSHCERVRSYAERLVHDGVDIILDQWSLSEGQDKYAFMEKTVADPTVTHVLIFSDKQYAHKADERKAGVGTESQLISKEVYDKVDQKKFIPIVCERQEDGEPFLPAFLKSRIWIDFSTPEAINENWEKLIRVLYGKPIHEKPSLGSPPSFITESETRPSLPTIGKFATLRDALINARPFMEYARKDFLKSAIEYVDTLRVREKPNVKHIDEKVLADLHSMLPIRDQLIDWFILEATPTSARQFDSLLTSFMEQVLALKYRPAEVTQWNEAWFDAHSLFVYELFLYLIAVLIASEKYSTVRHLLTTNYLLPDSEAERGRDFATYEEFWTHSSALRHRNERLKLQRLSMVADVVKERATRKDIPFRDVMQAELVIFLAALLSKDKRWYPHTIVFAGHGRTRFPFFLRAAQHSSFDPLRIIYGVDSGDTLRQKYAEGYERHQINKWHDIRFWGGVSSFDELLNMKILDTLD